MGRLDFRLEDTRRHLAVEVDRIQEGTDLVEGKTLAGGVVVAVEAAVENNPVVGRGILVVVAPADCHWRGEHRSVLLESNSLNPHPRLQRQIQRCSLLEIRDLQGRKEVSRLRYLSNQKEQ